MRKRYEDAYFMPQDDHRTGDRHQEDDSKVMTKSNRYFRNFIRRRSCACKALCLVTCISVFLLLCGHLYIAYTFPGQRFSLTFYRHYIARQISCHNAIRSHGRQPCDALYRFEPLGGENRTEAEIFVRNHLMYPQCDKREPLNLRFSFLCDPSTHAQAHVIWKTYFQRAKGGFFVEAGGFEGEIGSSSLMFERLGWSGILIEPSSDFFMEMLSKKRQIYSLNACLSGPTADDKVIYKQFVQTPDNPFNSHIVDDNPRPDGVIVPCVNLHHILDYMKIDTVAFLSLDVELFELAVLKSLPLDRIRFNVMMVEGNSRNKNIIDYYLTKRNYLLQFVFHESGADKYDRVYVHQEFAERMNLVDAPLVEYLF